MSEHHPSLGEEIANAITHGAGLLASLIALPVLIWSAARSHDGARITGAAIFGITLCLLYTASTLYHSFPRGRTKRLFRVLDHGAIYLLIAGTYTPFALGALRGPWGWSLLVVSWVLAVAGVLMKATVGFRYEKLSTAIYVAMGWMAIVAIKPLMEYVAPMGLVWLIVGGVCYTGGVVFYATDRRITYGHAIWHLFVAAGSVCHFFAVLGYAAGAR
ncbi:MAG: PAQR family membrane homeostasis protein TrhA [Gemmatimonas sp.]|nr:hemolysin III family protein [Gemmatimonadaceae bacterium]